MKNSILVFFLFFICSSTLSAQNNLESSGIYFWFDTVYIEPANPHVNDSVYLIYETTHTSMVFDNVLYQISQTGSVIDVWGCQAYGQGASMDMVRDTLNLGVQPLGIQTVNLRLIRGLPLSPSCLYPEDTIDATINFNVRLEPGISINYANNMLEVYPNPILNVPLHLKSSSPIQSIMLFNVVGKLMYENTNLRGYEKEIRLNDFPRGVYSLVVNTGGEILTKKIVKQ